MARPYGSGTARDATPSWPDRAANRHARRALDDHGAGETSSARTQRPRMDLHRRVRLSSSSCRSDPCTPAGNRTAQPRARPTGRRAGSDAGAMRSSRRGAFLSEQPDRDGISPSHVATDIGIQRNRQRPARIRPYVVSGDGDGERACRAANGAVMSNLSASPTRPAPCRSSPRVCCGLRPRRSVSRPSRERPEPADLGKARPRPAQGKSPACPQPDLARLAAPGP